LNFYFWTSLWGWSLVLTNLIALPLMNAVGLFLEESEEKDYQGLVSFIALSYIVVPFQAYASVKGFLQREEGPWFRTPKTGLITDVFTRGKFFRFISGILPGGGAQPAMHQASFPSNLNQYLALSTANSQFSSFKLKPKQARWLGKLVVVSLLVASTILLSLAPGISSMNIVEAKGFGMIAGSNVKPNSQTGSRDNKQEQVPKYVDKEDLSWGVLAINTNKSVYTKGETVMIQIAVLNEQGEIECGADISLEIQSPQDHISVLSTDNGLIQKSPTCDKKAKVAEPDFYTYYASKVAGKYEMKLEATTKNGMKLINDSFKVSDEILFDIERNTATRIYPKADYSVIFTVKAHKDYQGIVTEKVPQEFIISNINNKELGKYLGGKVNWESTEFLGVKGDNREKIIDWVVDWKKGETYHFGYIYDAPNQSPALYLIGPLQVGDFEEARRWQIASDSPGPGDMLIAREAGGGQQLEGTTWKDITWDTTTREDDSAVIDHTFTDSEVYLKEVGRYLVIYNVAGENDDDVDAIRREYESRLEINDAAINYGRSAGYVRESDSNMTMNMWAATVIYNNSTTNRLEVAVAEQSTTQVTDVRTNLSGIQVLRLDDSWDYLRLYKDNTSATSTYGTWTDVTWNNEDEDDFAGHSTGSADITIPTTGRYLVTYQVHWDNTGTVRQTGLARITMNGTEVDGTRTQGYQRNATSDDAVSSYAGILNLTASQTFTVEITNDTTGGGSFNTLNADTGSSITMVKLDDNADYVRLGRDTTSQTASDNQDIDWNEELEDDGDFNWDGSPADQIDINTTGDYLMFSTIYMYRDPTVNDRDSFESYVAIDGTPVTYGSSQDFIRGANSGENTGAGGRSLGIMGQIDSGSYIEIHTEHMGDAVYVAGATWVLDRIAFQAVRLDDLFGTTSTSADATGWSWQRKTFKDTANSNYWRAFYDGAEIDIEHSSDGSAWTPISSISQNTNDFSFWYRTGDTYVYICYDNSDDIEVMRGTLGASNITWGSSGIALNGTGASDTYDYCNIARDSSGYLWVVGRHYDGTNYEIEVADTTAADPATPSFNASSSLSATSSTDVNTYGAMTPLGSQDMYVTWKRGANIEGCFWDDGGGQWENTGGSGGSTCSAGSNVDSIDTGITGLDDNISALSDDTNYDVHLAYIEDDATDTVSYNRWDNGSGTNGTWQTEITLDTSDTDAYVSISYDENTEDLYAVYIDTSNNYIKYRQCDVTTDATDCSTIGNWQTEQDWKTTGTNTNVTTNYGGGGEIFALWTEGSGSPYTINWDTIIVPEYLWLFFGLGPFLPGLINRHRKRKK